MVIDASLTACAKTGNDSDMSDISEPDPNDPEYMDYFYATDISAVTDGGLPNMLANVPKIIVRSDYEYKQQ